MTLLIADDHPLYRNALAAALAKYELLEAADLSQTIEQLENRDIDLLLLDLHMPGSGDLYGLIRIRKLFPDLPVAVVSGIEDPHVIAKVMGAGALGFIPKTASAEHIGQAVEAMLEGDVWLQEEVKSRMTGVDQAFSALLDNIASLTPAQYKVLCCMREGLLNKQIGDRLSIAEATVKAHITAVFRKLGINNRTQAVLIASQLELEPVD